MGQNPYKFDLTVKGQRRIRIMNVRDKSSHGKPMSKHKKVRSRTRICTDRQTDKVIEQALTTFIFFSKTTGPIPTTQFTKHLLSE